MKASGRNKPERVAGVVGVGLDAADGHKRLTRGRDFLLAGGSEETHSAMQETMIKVTEKLDAKSKGISDASPQELRDLIADAAP